MRSGTGCSLRGAVLALSVLGVAAAPSVRAQAARAESSPSAGAPAAAAPASARQGMWVSAGLGAGDANLHCRICAGEQPTRGTSGYLRVGTTVSPSFLIGAEANGWMRSDPDGRQRVLALTGNAYWYPNPRHGYYLKGGFGISRYRYSERENDVTTALTSAGLAGQVGAGYEVRVNPRTSVVPYVNLIGSARGRLATERDDGTHFDRDRLSTGAHLLFVQIGLGVTWH